ncbi:MAG: hypothetical protein WAW86_07860 [Gammaproteobacteria bacterium]
MIIKIKLAANLFKHCSALEEKRIRSKLIEYQTHGIPHGADLKKISENLYQVRINREARLDLIKHPDDDHTYIAVRARPHHEDITALPSNLQSETSIPCEASSSSSASSSNPDTLEISEYSGSFSYYNGTYIHLDDTQIEASELKMPFILSGAPGSGKSCVALEILKNIIRALQENPPEEMTRLLFITENPNLAQSMMKMFNDSGIELPPNTEVLFRTPAQLYKEKHPQARLLGEEDIDEKEHCLRWLETEIKKTSPLSKEELENAYQEFRIISKYTTEEEYIANKGSQDTLYPEETEQHLAKRKWLFSSFRRYKQSLGERVNLQFTAIESLYTYQAIVYDEALDGSRIQQASIISLVENGNIAILAGHHQGLSDNTNSCHFLEQELYNQFGKEITHKVLTISYRSFAENIHFSNAMLQLKYHFSGGIAFKREIPFVQPPLNGKTGLLSYIKTKAALGSLPIDDINFAIIYDTKHTQEMIEEFGQLNVATGKKELPDCAYTVGESKGLEFRTVLIFKPFNGSKQAIFEEISSMLPDLEKFHYQKDINKMSRPNKHAAIDLKYNTAIHGLFVANSRAKQQLIFFQPSHSKTRRLEQFLEDAIKKINTLTADKAPPKASSSNSLPQPIMSPIIEDAASDTKKMIIDLFNTNTEKNKSKAIRAISRLLNQKRYRSMAHEILTELHLENHFFQKPETAEEIRIKKFINQIKRLAPKKRKSLISSLTHQTANEFSILHQSFDFKELMSELLEALTIDEKMILLPHLELLLENQIQDFGDIDTPDEYAEEILKIWDIIFKHYSALTKDSLWIDEMYNKIIHPYENEVENMSSFFFTKLLMLMMSYNKKILVNSKIFPVLLINHELSSTFLKILQIRGEEFFIRLCEDAPEIFFSFAYIRYACAFLDAHLTVLPRHKAWDNLRKLIDLTSSEPIPLAAMNSIEDKPLLALFFGYEERATFLKKIVSCSNAHLSMLDYLILHRIETLRIFPLPSEMPTVKSLSLIITQLTERGEVTNKSILSVLLRENDMLQHFYNFLRANKSNITADEWGLILLDIFADNELIHELGTSQDGIKVVHLLYSECVYREDTFYYHVAKAAMQGLIPLLLATRFGLTSLKLILFIQTELAFRETVAQLVADYIGVFLSPTAKAMHGVGNGSALALDALKFTLADANINALILLALSKRLYTSETECTKKALLHLKTSNPTAFSTLANNPEIAGKENLSKLFFECSTAETSIVNASIFNQNQGGAQANQASSSHAKPN